MERERHRQTERERKRGGKKDRESAGYEIKRQKRE